MSNRYFQGVTNITQRILMLVIVFAATLFSAQTALAESVSVGVQSGAVSCVVGTVINYDETPNTNGWTITATPIKPPGSPTTQISDSQGKFKFDPLDPGTYTFSIGGLAPNWVAITPDTFDVPVDYSGDCVVIRFKIKRLIEVEVFKIDDDHKPWKDWTICAVPDPSKTFDQQVCQTTNVSGTTTFKLTPGKWNFVENVAANGTVIPVMPTTGEPMLDVQAPGPYTIRFKNVAPLPMGCIDVYKYDSPPNNQIPFPLPGWEITVKTLAGTVVGSGKTDTGGKISFCNLPIGPYVVTETAQKAWTPAAGTASIFNVTVVADQAQLVQFFNTQDRGYCFVGRKIDSNGKVGLPGWTITLKPLAVGGIALGPVVTDGLGNYRVCVPKDEVDYRVPGASYDICEVAQAGWIAVSATCYKATFPLHPDAPVEVPDFENRQAGHTESHSEKPPTGSPPAIGCSTMHTVKHSEYLSGIAAKYMVTTYKLKLANPWVLGRYQFYIVPGEQLCIPN